MQGAHVLCISALFFGMEEAGMKLKVKMFIDFLMTVALLLLMVNQVTGEKFHEWIGVFMFFLFIMHNVLNIRWYGNLFRGKYRLLRIIHTLINLAVFITRLCLMYSGIIMSRYVFTALPIKSGMALSRVMHLFGSYWGFVLMSVHLGLHWGVVIGILRKLSGGRNLTVVLWIMRLLAVLIAGYGAFCFRQEDILSYMFLKVEFAFIDYDKNTALVLVQYMAMMGLWIFIAYYMAKGVGKVSAISQKGKEKKRCRFQEKTCRK